MDEQISPLNLANALALATAVLWVLRALLVALFPAFSLIIMKMWTHGLDVSVMGAWHLTPAPAGPALQRGDEWLSSGLRCGVSPPPDRIPHDAGRRLTWTNFILGGISLVVSAWISGLVPAWAWNTVTKNN